MNEPPTTPPQPDFADSPDASNEPLTNANVLPAEHQEPAHQDAAEEDQTVKVHLHIKWAMLVSCRYIFLLFACSNA